MCRSKAEGGQRCYTHALEAWRVAARRVDRQAGGLGSAREAAKADPANKEAWRAIKKAEDRYEQARTVMRQHLVEMASTKEGERGLTKRISEESDPGKRQQWQSIYDEGQQLRRTNTDKGRANAAARLVVGVNGARYGLDETQTEAVWRRTLRSARNHEGDQDYADAKKWGQFVDAERAELAEDERLTDTQFDRARRNLDTAARTRPTRYVANAAFQFRDRAERAAAALDRQVDLGAGMRGVPREEYRERVAAFRKQYQELPENQRPAPPEDWVAGVTKKDRQAVSMPDDPATQWSHYRAQADPDAFPNADRSFVSVDIETAGPAGPSGFQPENGQIIEVGLVAYNENQVEVGSYASLVKPEQAPYGTGATHIHHISEDDVKDAPSWDQVAPQVAARLQGRTMLAQNSPFEDRWLSHHMGQENQDWRPGSTLDTLRVAQQHTGNEERHTLDRICARVGVPYGEDGQGHRAEHDARVAAKAWFGLRDQIENTYRSDPKRRALPQPARLAAKAHPTAHTPMVKKPTGVNRPRNRASHGTGGARSHPARETAEAGGGAGEPVGATQPRKGQRGVQQCPNCGRFAGASHTCPDRSGQANPINASTDTPAVGVPTTGDPSAAEEPSAAGDHSVLAGTPYATASGGGSPRQLSMVAAANEFEGMRKVIDVPLADYAPAQVRDRLNSEEFRTLLNTEATTRQAWETAEQAREEGTGTAMEYHRALDAHRAAQVELLAYREETARVLEGTATTQEADFTLPDGVHQVGDAEAGSAEWQRLRQGTVGGSDVGALVKAGKWGRLNYQDVRAAKMDLDPQDEPHDGASWVGDVWEPHLANIASDVLGEPVYTNKGTFSDGTRHANIDGFTKDDDRVGTVVEMKTSASPTDWEDTPPDGYVLQTQHYVDVLGARDGLLVANINDDRLVVYRVNATDKVQAGPDTNKGMGAEFTYSDVRDYCEKTVTRWNTDREAKREATSAGTAATSPRRRFDLKDDEKATWRDALTKGYVIVDLETTHTSAQRGHVLEFAGTDDQGNSFTSLYDVPDDHAAWNGTGPVDVHGIDRSMLHGKPILHEDETARARLRDFIGDRVVIAHNAGFEKKWLDEVGVPVRTADTQRAFGALVNDERLPDNTMRSLSEWAGVKYEDAHRAGRDVDMLSQAFAKLRPLLEDATKDNRDGLKDAS